MGLAVKRSRPVIDLELDEQFTTEVLFDDDVYTENRPQRLGLVEVIDKEANDRGYVLVVGDQEIWLTDEQAMAFGNALHVRSFSKIEVPQWKTDGNGAMLLVDPAK